MDSCSFRSTFVMQLALVEHLLYSKNSSVHLLWIISFNPHNNLMKWILFLSPFYR